MGRDSVVNVSRHLDSLIQADSIVDCVRHAKYESSLLTSIADKRKVD
jgi:hypothetical protein